MLDLLTIHPTKLKVTLETLKPLVRPRFPEQPKPEGPGGRPRQWPRWLIIALALIGASLNWSWAKYTEELRACEQVLQDLGAKGAPRKTSLFNAWRSISETQLIHQTTQLGKLLVPAPEGVAIDSTGFVMKGGTLWRVVKWSKSLLKRTSKLFYKAHIIVDTASHVVLSLALSPAHRHDVKRTGRLLKTLGKRLLKPINWLFGDKAYHDQKFENYLVEQDIRPVIEPKSNFVDHGTNSARDRSVRLYLSSPELWKKTFRVGLKAAVEHVFGFIKLGFVPLRERLPLQKRKRLLLYFFQYNFRLYLHSDAHKS